MRWAVDENLNNDILRGLLRRKPDVDIVRVQVVAVEVTRTFQVGLRSIDHRRGLLRMIGG